MGFNHWRLFRRALNDASQPFHRGPGLIISESLWSVDFRLIDLQHETFDSVDMMRFHRYVLKHAPLAIIRGMGQHDKVPLLHMPTWHLGVYFTPMTQNKKP